MIRVATPLLVAVLLGLGGCGVAGEPGDSARDSPSEEVMETDEAEPTEEITAKDGTDVDACMDGTCEVELSEPQTITFDEKTGFAPLVVSAIDAATITVGIENFGETTMSVGSRLESGGMAVEVIEISEEAVILSIS